jgi:hypothetical protein
MPYAARLRAPMFLYKKCTNIAMMLLVPVGLLKGYSMALRTSAPPTVERCVCVVGCTVLGAACATLWPAPLYYTMKHVEFTVTIDGKSIV